MEGGRGFTRPGSRSDARTRQLRRPDINDDMNETVLRSAAGIAIIASLLAACTSPKRVPEPTQPTAGSSQPALPDPGAPAEPSAAAQIPPVAGALPNQPPAQLQKGALERFDCLTGTPDWHARIAFEAKGGEVLGFAYYSKWRPRTCSIDLMRNAAGSKWHTAADGAVRVETAQGRFHIRTRADAYEFQFEHVQRRKFCGMPGEINGTMIIKRGTATPQCSATGIMDTNDPYLDGLYKTKR